MFQNILNILNFIFIKPSIIDISRNLILLQIKNIIK